ncbi:unnamed protein product, partial [Effrenium voratum]
MHWRFQAGHGWAMRTEKEVGKLRRQWTRAANPSSRVVAAFNCWRSGNPIPSAFGSALHVTWHGARMVRRKYWRLFAVASFVVAPSFSPAGWLARRASGFCLGGKLLQKRWRVAVRMAAAADIAQVDGVDKRRCRRLNKAAMMQDAPGPVIYWMSRDQRCDDNWALIYAQKLAIQRSVPLHVVFCLVPKFLDATIRQFDFLLKGLKEVDECLKSKKIPFHLRLGKAVDEIPELVSGLKAKAVVCDMSPLRVPRQWARDVAEACQAKEVPVVQVDAHNIVPVWAASDKQETAARTIRKKITLSLSTYLTDFPSVLRHPHSSPKDELPEPIDWEAAERSLEVDWSVKPVTGFQPGAKAGLGALEEFTTRLSRYAAKRNDPNVDALSGLSPWLHFGQISAQRCALRVRSAGEAKGVSSDVQKGCEAFIEESVVRRELSDNFCFYN